MYESGRICRLGLLICLSAALFAIAGPSSAGIDHVVELDQSGIWKRETEQNLLIGASVFNLGLAIWEGSENRLGNTAWRGVDSQLISGVSTEILKRVFTRERPSTTNDPNNWFAGDSNHSFPSGEAASAAALVTPYMLEYGKEQPVVYGLALFPLYVGVARVKAQAHWQTDVLAGWAIGAASGWYALRREKSLILQILPGGAFVGLKKSF
jgi:undecaprenyl-diphosphatase